MRRSLLVENRKERMKKSLQNLNKELEDLNNSGYLEIASSEYLDRLSGLKNNSVLPDWFLEDFDLLMIHYSFAKDNMDKLSILSQLPRLGKDVVFFGGGINEVLYHAENSRSRLSLSARVFYSKNLIEFLKKNKDDETLNLLYLAYGSNWKLPILLEARRFISYYGYEAFTKDGPRRDKVNNSIPELKSIFDSSADGNVITKHSSSANEFQSILTLGDGTSPMSQNNGNNNVDESEVKDVAERYMDEINYQIDIIFSKS